MAKAIMETSPDINSNIRTDEIAQTSVGTCCQFMMVPYQIKRICTKKDNFVQTVIVKIILEEKSVRDA